jgi:hypothetical protein
MSPSALSLRSFIEQQLSGAASAAPATAMPPAHVVSHLVERSVRRAALDAATHRYDRPPEATDGTASVSWPQCLLVAALTELRPIKMLSRN